MSASLPARPTPAEYAPFYARYVALVPEADVLAVLARQAEEVRALCAKVPAERELFRYAPDKWTLREVLGHLIDAERVFGFRAFCFSRGERQPLPGFDENEYVARAPSNDRTLAELAAELGLVREGNLAALCPLEGPRWRQVGTASGHPVSVQALAFIMAGHVRHHQNVLRERYGV